MVWWTTELEPMSEQDPASWLAAHNTACSAPGSLWAMPGSNPGSLCPPELWCATNVPPHLLFLLLTSRLSRLGDMAGLMADTRAATSMFLNSKHSCFDLPMLCFPLENAEYWRKYVDGGVFKFDSVNTKKSTKNNTQIGKKSNKTIVKDRKRFVQMYFLKN